MTQELNLQQRTKRDLTLPGLLGILWVILFVPLFIRMPLTNDAVLYDLESRWIGEGIVPYRDVVEANFPGVLVIHYATRSLLGESNEALKTVDLLIFSLILLVSAIFVCKVSQNYVAAIWGVSLSLLFYLSQSEWCHCQRDTWLLLPALLGTLLRLRQVDQTLEQDSISTFSYSALEGVVWGCGIWLKPHLLIICVAVWALSLFMIEGVNRKSTDGFGLLVGGIFTGAVGLFALIEISALDAFITSLQEWNPGYLAARFDNWTLIRYVGMSFRFTPWIFLHFLAIPIAIWALYILVFRTRDSTTFGRAALSALYLVWFLQSHLLQHLFDYVHVPAIVLAILILVSHVRDFNFLNSPALLIAFLAVAILTSPIVTWQRAKLWPLAVQQDLPPEQTDQVAQLPNPKWGDLRKVEDYLRSQQVQGTDVLMFNSDLVTLYWNLNLMTPTPYVYMFELQHFFPERKELFREAMLAGEQKYVVTDLVSCGMRVDVAEKVDEFGELAPPPGYRRANLKHYPWSEPVVFRSGRYLVHKVRSEESQ